MMMVVIVIVVSGNVNFIECCDGYMVVGLGGFEFLIFLLLVKCFNCLSYRFVFVYG